MRKMPRKFAIALLLLTTMVYFAST